MKYFITTLVVIAIFAVTCYAQDSSGISRVYSNSIPARDVAVSSNYAYVAAYDYSATLRVIDISNSTFPVLRGTWGNVTGQGTAVAISGNYAYVGAGEYFYAINISNPDTLTQVGALHLNTVQNFTSMKVVGNYAYCSYNGWSAGGLTIINIANPASPTQTGCWNWNASVNDVVVFNSYAYVATNVGGVPPNFHRGGLRAINVANPASPTEVGHYDLNLNNLSGSGVALIGNYAYLSVSYGSGSGSGLLVINVANPSSPSQVWSSSSLASTNSVTISGNRAYVAAGSNGLHVFDISNPSSPTQTSFYNGLGTALRVAVSGNYAYVAETTSFVTYNCSAVDAVSEQSVLQPSGYHVAVYPNPFNPTTTIQFSIPKTSNVNIVIYDAAGRVLKSLAQGKYTAGEHHVLFDGNNLPSGIYFAHIQAGTFNQAQKLMLVK